jgi:hypothetical protein
MVEELLWSREMRLWFDGDGRENRGRWDGVFGEGKVGWVIGKKLLKCICVGWGGVYGGVL